MHSQRANNRVCRPRRMWIRATMVLVIATQQLLLANLAVTSAAEVESLPVNLEQGEDGGEENTFVADYLGEQGEFEVEPDPPFLGSASPHQICTSCFQTISQSYGVACGRCNR
eukprot:3818717-Rhodomonas_salina.1